MALFDISSLYQFSWEIKNDFFNMVSKSNGYKSNINRGSNIQSYTEKKFQYVKIILLVIWNLNKFLIHLWLMWV